MLITQNPKDYRIYKEFLGGNKKQENDYPVERQMIRSSNSQERNPNDNTEKDLWVHK